MNKQINLSAMLQLLCVASLIICSWFNLQRQLDLLQHDVTMLIDSNTRFYQKMESLNVKSIEYEYRLQTLEKVISSVTIAESSR